MVGWLDVRAVWLLLSFKIGRSRSIYLFGAYFQLLR